MGSTSRTLGFGRKTSNKRLLARHRCGLDDNIKLHLPQLDCEDLK